MTASGGPRRGRALQPRLQYHGLRADVEYTLVAEDRRTTIIRGVP
jgi:hypothetical protein